jgi:hypothetical protein
MAEFSTLARKTPADVLILDVRNKDEANAGMIKGLELMTKMVFLAKRTGCVRPIALVYLVARVQARLAAQVLGLGLGGA